ncbi:MAG: hypothetical protein NTW28_30625 [Candidatus Solibacter sp.]|nr:hypothetical protein [Candidatus Solibacter sp.]
MRELSPNEKEAVEKLLGRRLAEEEEISIWASVPHAAPAGKARTEAWRQLDQHLDRLGTRAEGTAEELEKLADEVSGEVRHPPQ